MCFPLTSTTFAPRGTSISAPPIAVILPLSSTIVPLVITPRVTVWIVAPLSTTGCVCGDTVMPTCALAVTANAIATAMTRTARSVQLPVPLMDESLVSRSMMVMVSYAPAGGHAAGRWLAPPVCLR